MSYPTAGDWSIATSYIALSISLLVIGYYIGIGRSLFSYSNRAHKKGDDSCDDDEDYDSELDTDLSDKKVDMNAVKAALLEECKLVLIVRTDLKMDKGKIAAQCSHATLACYKALHSGNPSLLRKWERSGQAKVALKCSSEEELLDLEARAKALNLCARTIRDAGRTQIAAGSITVLGIGPGPVNVINKVTSHLKLL